MAIGPDEPATALPGPRIAVEVADHRFARRRFRDLPVALHAGDRAWSPPLAADPDRTRSRPRRRADPWFEAGGVAALLLARVAGSSRPLARCTAHLVPGQHEGWFGLLDVPDDELLGGALVAALVRHAAVLLSAEGCTSLEGPASYRLDQEAGVVVAGADLPPVTGRPATPGWLAGALAGAGLEPGREQRWWAHDPRSLAAAEPSAVASAALARTALPRSVAPFADARLAVVVPGVGRIVAVPDLAAAKRAGLASGAGAWSLARTAAARAFEGCCVVRVEGPPERLVPALAASAADAGYATLHAPWAPPGAGEPSLVARTYRQDLTPAGTEPADGSTVGGDGSPDG